MSLLLCHAIEPMPEGAHQRLAAYPQYPAGCSVAVYNWQPDTSSHVVLAACQKNENVQEEEDDDKKIHGVFTKSLVDSLTSGQGSTYVGLIAGLPTGTKNECRLSFLGRSLSLSFKHSCTCMLPALSDIVLYSHLRSVSTLRIAGIHPTIFHSRLFHSSSSLHL
ncbi:hypothetical protein ARMGADRAFT_1078452 [Armillaria gallica]|uniref:Uncharacterized protein n=1 Tax=Armillaria gallica TaxID=47427 RepID=A0A2H3DH91_ARMGA|nr:hypothetical protein ARMGADRAFT_1078452 [Armillaria gallica]